MGHGFIFWIIAGAIAGFLTGKIMSGEGYGIFMDIIVGIVGAFVGGFLMTHLLGASASGGLIYSVVVATVGAIILTLLLRLITGGRSRNL